MNKLIIAKQYLKHSQPIIVLINSLSEGVFFLHLRGDLCKSGPGHFASEKSFPQTFPNKLSLVTSK